MALGLLLLPMASALIGAAITNQVGLTALSLKDAAIAGAAGIPILFLLVGFFTLLHHLDKWYKCPDPSKTATDGETAYFASENAARSATNTHLENIVPHAGANPSPDSYTCSSLFSCFGQH